MLHWSKITMRVCLFTTCENQLIVGLIFMIDQCAQLLFILQISATATRTATMRAKTDTKMDPTPARFPLLQRTGRTTRRAQLRGTSSAAVNRAAEFETAGPGLRKARLTQDRARLP